MGPIGPMKFAKDSIIFDRFAVNTRGLSAGLVSVGDHVLIGESFDN